MTNLKLKQISYVPRPDHDALSWNWNVSVSSGIRSVPSASRIQSVPAALLKLKHFVGLQRPEHPDSILELEWEQFLGKVDVTWTLDQQFSSGIVESKLTAVRKCCHEAFIYLNVQPHWELIWPSGLFAALIKMRCEKMWRGRLMSCY